MVSIVWFILSLFKVCAFTWLPVLIDSIILSFIIGNKQAKGDDLLQNFIVAGIVCIQGQLLGHEAHRGVVDAVDLLNGILHLGGTVGAVDLELVMLLHNSFLLI